MLLFVLNVFVCIVSDLLCDVVRLVLVVLFCVCLCVCFVKSCVCVASLYGVV